MSEFYNDFEKNEAKIRSKFGLSEEDIKEIITPAVERCARTLSYIYYHLTKNIVDRLGWNQGKDLIEKAIIEYGEEQGRLVRSKIDEAGLEPNLTNHFKYRLTPLKYTAPKSEAIYRKPWALKSHVHACTFPETWKNIGPEALKLGDLFCSVVDDAIIRGYNPRMKWNLEKCLCRNDEYCEHNCETTIK